MKNPPFSDKVFPAISGISFLFVLTESILQSLGKSICPADGCRFVALSARYGDFSILLIGLLLFAALFFLSIRNLKSNSPVLDRTINLVLVVSLAAEGFFTGYQAFRLHTACVFCLTVFGFIFVLGLLRLVSGHRELVAGFASLAAVFSLFYLVLPAQQSIAIPPDKQMVLFYSEDCKHCAEVVLAIDKNQLPVNHVLVKEYAGLLKSMGIEHVPTLYVNKNNEKLFLTGKDPILSYLNCKQEGTGAKPGTSEKKQQPKKEHRTSKQGSGLGLENLGGQTGPTFELIDPASDDDICKPEAECK